MKYKNMALEFGQGAIKLSVNGQEANAFDGFDILLSENGDVTIKLRSPRFVKASTQKALLGE